MTPRRVARLALLLIIAAFVFGVSMTIGAAHLPLREVIAALGGAGDETTRAIVLHLRLPRAVLALLVGGALGLAGAVFQALLRNPLAEPWVLGVSGGAAVGAVTAVVLGWSLLAPWSVPLAAFAGALLAILLVLRIATYAASGLDTRVLILAGLVVAAFFNAVIQLLLTFASGETFRSALFWMMGSLAAADWTSVVLLTAYMLPAMAALLLMARPLNLLAVGEETALYLGTRVERVKLASYLIASLLVAATVAVSGIIGFVGLIVPHAIRLMWGSDHQLLFPASVLLGGGFLLAADTAARTVAAPAELPLGVITALVGVPLFVLLLTRRAV
ncbi:MAG: iron ABC transporter permease [Gemmatimonadota bacterium]|jgi:iron complex transport system permease protein|nr:MAG: iron ABC transporter permease [Gemmatimonadota bacterium]